MHFSSKSSGVIQVFGFKSSKQCQVWWGVCESACQTIPKAPTITIRPFSSSLSTVAGSQSSFPNCKLHCKLQKTIRGTSQILIQSSQESLWVLEWYSTKSPSLKITFASKSVEATLRVFYLERVFMCSLFHLSPFNFVRVCLRPSLLGAFLQILPVILRYLRSLQPLLPLREFLPCGIQTRQNVPLVMRFLFFSSLQIYTCLFVFRSFCLSLISAVSCHVQFLFLCFFLLFLTVK